MATTVKTGNRAVDKDAAAPLSAESHRLLIDYLKGLINRHNGGWWRDRLQTHDLLYYCMRRDLFSSKALAAKAAGMGWTEEDLQEAPIIMSQLETAVAVLADTFLSGYPVFGVVAPPSRKKEAEQVETLVANYSEKSSWRANLLRYFNLITKHNIAPIGVISRHGYSMDNELDVGEHRVRAVMPYILPDIIVPDPYNTMVDFRVDPKDSWHKAEYVGYAEMLPLVAIKELIIAVRSGEATTSRKMVNLDKMWDTVVPHCNFHMHPAIVEGAVDEGFWDRWLIGTTDNSERVRAGNYYYANHGLLRKMWLRIVPNDFKLNKYGANTPLVFEVWLFNDEYIIYFSPVYLPENMFPLGMTSLGVDDFGYLGKSDTMMLAPFQMAASTMLNASVLGAERSVDDRAIYDTNFISAANLTAQSGSAYIPLTKSIMQDKRLDDVYKSIPFDASNAFQLPGLIRVITDTAQMLRGRNNFAQGLPQKGNRTLGEFSNVMQNSDLRQALPATQIEINAFSRIKVLLKAWIGSHATRETLLNHKSKEMVEITPQTIADLAYDFKMCTGYFSKATVGNLQVFQTGLQMIAQLPQLQQQYNLPELFAYVMSLAGAKDFDQFITGQVQPLPSVPGEEPEPQLPPGAAPAPGQIPQEYM